MAQSVVSRRTTTYTAKMHGNTARNIYEVPRHQERPAGPVSVPRRRHKQENDTLSIPYCIFLGLACVLTLTLGAYYLQQQALCTSSQKTIASLEGQLAELKKVNADELNRIESSVNLEEIRDIAMNELGMVYATGDNVILYDNTTQNYVSQHQEIPREDGSALKSVFGK